MFSPATFGETQLLSGSIDLSRRGVEQAYAWLPLRSYGLRFLIQADWRVPSSREAITEAVFNQHLDWEKLVTETVVMK